MVFVVWFNIHWQLLDTRKFSMISKLTILLSSMYKVEQPNTSHFTIVIHGSTTTSYFLCWVMAKMITIPFTMIMQPFDLVFYFIVFKQNYILCKKQTLSLLVRLFTIISCRTHAKMQSLYLSMYHSSRVQNQILQSGFCSLINGPRGCYHLTL